MVNFAAEWLAGLYGAEVKKAIKRSHATRWNSRALALGAWSAAVPGGQGARRILMEPMRRTRLVAGEAAHETLWGTVGGAWESGERAADAVLRRLGPSKPAPPEATPRRSEAQAEAAERYSKHAEHHRALALI
jgi:monoamine oxidase